MSIAKQQMFGETHLRYRTHIPLYDFHKRPFLQLGIFVCKKICGLFLKSEEKKDNIMEFLLP